MARSTKAALVDDHNPLLDAIALEARRETPEARCDRMAATNDHSQGLEIFTAAVSGQTPAVLPGELTDDLLPLLQRIMS